MNRRAAIKLVISVGFIGLAFFWLFKKFGIGTKVDLGKLVNGKSTIDHLAETIIPETHSPGAMRAQVGDFIVRMVTDCSTAKEQRNFLKGLESVDSFCRRNYGLSFTQCDLNDRISTLEHLEGKAISRFGILNKINNRLFGAPFIIQLKALTVEGYCTSELGAIMGLAYDPIPVHYVGCIPLAPEQKTWAIQ